MSDRDKNGARWHRIRARIRATGAPCGICGEPIDYSLRTPDPMSFEVDHIVPVSKGGAMYDMRNLQASHRKCNRAKSDKMQGEQAKRPLPVVHSRRW